MEADTPGYTNFINKFQLNYDVLKPLNKQIIINNYFDEHFKQFIHYLNLKQTDLTMLQSVNYDCYLLKIS